MKDFLLSLKFILKRVFRLTGTNIAWLIATAFIVVIGTDAMALEPVARGDYDYQFYLMMLPFLSVFLSFGLSSVYSDVYASVYIRTSRLYKCLRTRAVQVFMLIFDVAALIPAVIVTAVANPAALPDFILISAIVIGISLPLSSAYFLMWLVFCGYSIFNLLSGFFGDGYMADGFAFMPAELTDSLPAAVLLAAAILLAGLILSFVVSDIIFRIRKRPQDRQMLKGETQA